MTGRKKQAPVKSAAIWAPVNADEADTAIAEIGELQRRRTIIETDLNEALAALKTVAEKEAAPVNARLKELTEGVHAFCAANRDALTDDGATKTHKFGNGEVSWRMRPPKVSIRDNAIVIASIKALRLAGEFLRIKEEIDKEAMLKNPELALTIPRVSIGSAGEDFVIKPFSTELEEVSRANGYMVGIGVALQDCQKSCSRR